MKRTFLILLLILVGISGYADDKQNVILISLDGFRWDYPNRGLSPTLSMIQEEGASASSLEPVYPSKTFPNHLSLVTGMYPENHGILLNYFRNPHTREVYRLGDSVSVRTSKWYQGEAIWETAERQNVTAASYFWPGSELPDAHRRPTYRELYDHNRPYEKRVQGVINWLKLPEDKRPRFITLYFHETDSKGHRYGPNSAEVDTAITLVDGLIGMLIKELKAIGQFEKTNIIIVSDHGMTDVHTDRIVNIESILSGFKCEYTTAGTMLMIKPQPGQAADIYNVLKKNERHYKVSYKEDLPAYYHFANHPYILPIIVEAELGWSVVDNRAESRLTRFPGPGGAHGYDNHILDMHGLFYAIGPAFKKGYRTGTVKTIDIYPLMCKILGIYPRQNIDGRLERISSVLK